MSATDGVVVSTIVAVDSATAFEVFTEEVDAWWKRGPRYRAGAERKSVMRFEPRIGGRLLEVYDGDEMFELGRVTAWEPPDRLAFDMGGRDLESGQWTRVEVRFESVDAGTRVTVEHRGWDQFPDGHPVRHGLAGPAFTNMMGAWWADLLVAVRSHAEETRRG